MPLTEEECKNITSKDIFIISTIGWRDTESNTDTIPTRADLRDIRCIGTGREEIVQMVRR